jgi:hypothetical protein
VAEEKLTDFIASLSGESHLRVQDDLGDGFVRLRAAEAQRRQAKQDIRSFEDVVIEMLRNARDAHANVIFVATWKQDDIRHMTMIDNGDGVPEHLHETIFEAFVTSKLDDFHEDLWGVHGRGMALYSIKQNCLDARILASARGLGSAFSVTSNPKELPERRDQSSVPAIAADDSGSMILRGPHNIIRTTMEFAINQRDSMAIYLGSPVEIAAALRGFALKLNSLCPGIEQQDMREIPYIQRFGFPQTPDEFSFLASSLGLEMSERSARRILDGEIEPVGTVLDLLGTKPVAEYKGGAPEPGFGPTTKAARRKIKFDSRDLERFSSQVASAFSELAEAYYLEDDVEPSIRVGADGIKISLPIEPKD